METNCNNCINRKMYRTGSDEYPANTNVEYCSKGHWENGHRLQDGESFDNCVDFELKPDKPKLLLIGMDAISKAEFLAKHPELADIEIIEEIPKSMCDSTMSELRNLHTPIEILTTPYIDAQFMDNRSPRNIRRQKERDSKKFNKKYKR
jgi:hypothetical protein